jgi:hypothetical protein
MCARNSTEAETGERHAFLEALLRDNRGGESDGYGGGVVQGGCHVDVGLAPSDAFGVCAFLDLIESSKP